MLVLCPDDHVPERADEVVEVGDVVGRVLREEFRASAPLGTLNWSLPEVPEDVGAVLRDPELVLDALSFAEVDDVDVTGETAVDALDPLVVSVRVAWLMPVAPDVDHLVVVVLWQHVRALQLQPFPDSHDLRVVPVGAEVGAEYSATPLY